MNSENKGIVGTYDTCSYINLSRQGHRKKQQSLIFQSVRWPEIIVSSPFLFNRKMSMYEYNVIIIVQR